MELIRKIIKMRKREEGAADLIVTLATIPFAVILILALIDISLFLNTKSYVQSSVRDGVRQAAMWGGSGDPSQVRLNTSGAKTQTNILNKIWDSSKGVCTQSHCESKPIVFCDREIATAAGQNIRCTVTYHYSSIVPASDLLGFGAITGAPFTVVENGLSETGYR
jgi:hypothetical protein